MRGLKRKRDSEEQEKRTKKIYEIKKEVDDRDTCLYVCMRNV
jgi:hypothetical protein